MELKRAYNSSDLGLFWAVAKPMMYMLMFYFAISTGFKSGKEIDGTVCPYFIWLASGIVPWQFISDLLVGGANSFNKHKDIVSKTRYPLSAIPTITVASRLYLHGIMTAVLIAVALVMGVKPCIYWLQLPIYILINIVFMYIWVLMTSLLNVLSTDLVEFIKTIRTAFFWLSGILFNIRGKHSIIFALNPISFIVEGYRNVFAYNIWIWEQKRLLMYFVIVTFVMTLFTFVLYRRLEKKLPEMF